MNLKVYSGLDYDALASEFDLLRHHAFKLLQKFNQRQVQLLC